MTATKSVIASCLSILIPLLTGCTGSRTSTPSDRPISANKTPSTTPMHMIDIPDPCTLIRPSEVSELAQLSTVTPKKEAGDHWQKCNWTKDQGHRGTSVLDISIFDFRSQSAARELQTIPPYDIECPGKIAIAADEYCQGRDRHSIRIIRKNLDLNITWTTTGISRTASETRRAKLENQLNRALARQVFENLPR